MLQLQVVGWIREDQVSALLRQLPHILDAIALNDPVERKFGHMNWNIFLTFPTILTYL